jgi:hypothetical protein
MGKRKKSRPPLTAEQSRQFARLDSQLRRYLRAVWRGRPDLRARYRGPAADWIQEVCCAAFDNFYSAVRAGNTEYTLRSLAKYGMAQWSCGRSTGLGSIDRSIDSPWGNAHGFNRVACTPAPSPLVPQYVSLADGLATWAAPQNLIQVL